MSTANSVFVLVLSALAAAAIVLVSNREMPRLSGATIPAAAMLPVRDSAAGGNQGKRKLRMCDGPIVYNKPAKTGSTSVQLAMISWAKRSGRLGIKCSSYLVKASMQLRECIPYDYSGCAVVATHMELDGATKELLRKRLGGVFVSITSTRAPQERLVSLYMQMKGIRSGEARKKMCDIAKFAESLNPWGLYNYHSGEVRTGSCPMREVEKRLLVNVVKQYDIVVDVDLADESNAILKSHDLFQMSKKRSNVRGSSKIVLNKEAKDAIKNVSCVEEELHRLFRMRMASLYEKATGKPCLSEQRNPITCF